VALRAQPKYFGLNAAWGKVGPGGIRTSKTLLVDTLSRGPAPKKRSEHPFPGKKSAERTLLGYGNRV